MGVVEREGMGTGVIEREGEAVRSLFSNDNTGQDREEWWICEEITHS